tara:strand:- start:1390 stop:1686 length:297 start_codon:yes stop_codon:yes gene_type:complete
MSLVKMETEVIIQVNKRKKVTKDALVVEGFKDKYIIVNMVDDDHEFTLKWNGFMYEGKFLEMNLTCHYNVERDFSSSKTKNSSSIKPVVLQRRTSGRP